MIPKTKLRVRQAAAAGFLLGIVAFANGWPFAVPEEQLAASRAAHEEWSQRHHVDIVHGRASTAGPPPKVEPRTSGIPALMVLGFLFMAFSIVAFIQTFM
jgi:hypothetical protein